MGELCELNPTAVLPDSFEYVDLESVAGTDMISHRREEKLTAPSRAQRLASFGDIFYQTVRPYQKNNYFYELPDEDYVFSTGYAQLRPLCDGRFLFSSLQRDQFVSCVLEHCTGTSYPAINANDLAALFLAVPIDAEEQRLVGSILKPIDSLITLHQRKCQYRGLYGYLSWEQRKLGELIQLGGSGGTPSANNPDYYGGDIPFLSIADINGRDITNTAKTLTDEGLQNSAAWIVPSGAVSLAMYASVGKVGIIRQDTATSQAFYNMVFDNEALRDFVFTRLEKAETDSEWEPYISTGTQRNLNADKVKSFSLDVPSNEEASEISAYFANLDTLITLHQ